MKSRSASQQRQRRLVGLSLLLLAALLPAGCSPLLDQVRHLTGDTQTRLAKGVVIERDGWGVPHIHGRNDPATAFGVAWAMAEDNYWQLEEAYIQDLGRAAYYYGEQYLADDLVRTAFQVEAHARAEYARLTAPLQRLLDGFAEGLNYYLRKHPETPRRVMARYEPWMVLARTRSAAMGAQRADGLRLGEIAALLGAPEAGWRERQPVSSSVAWAVSPARSASGQALLLASVHRPFFGSEQPYELEVHSESGWQVYGVAKLGTPVPYTGHNEQLGWGHGELSMDSAIVHRLLFDDPEDSLSYRSGADRERAVVTLDTVRVNTAAGVEARVYGVRRTPHGPVIARRGDTAYAVQLPGLEEGGALQQWHAMGLARSLAEFTAALQQAALPGVATVYADGEGNILRHAGDAEAPVVNPESGVIVAGGGSAAGRTAPADTVWSVAALERLALGTTPSPVRAEIEQLVYEWEQVGGRDSRRAFALDTAVDRLREWDGTVDSGSTAATLYQAWRNELRAAEDRGRTSETDGLGAGEPANAADGFPNFRALEAAVARMRREWGTVDVVWGGVNRLQRRHTSGQEEFRDDQPNVSVNGFPNGSLFVLQTVAGEDTRRYGVSGTAAILITEFTRLPRTRSIVVFGQRAEATSPHYFDQAAKYAKGELKDAWFGAEAARREARERYHPGERARVLHSETPAR